MSTETQTPRTDAAAQKYYINGYPVEAELVPADDMRKLEQALRDAQARIAALEADRERLDWWYERDNAGRITYNNERDVWIVDGDPNNHHENPRAAIDAARKTI